MKLIDGDGIVLKYTTSTYLILVPAYTENYKEVESLIMSSKGGSQESQLKLYNNYNISASCFKAIGDTTSIVADKVKEFVEYKSTNVFNEQNCFCYNFGRYGTANVHLHSNVVDAFKCALKTIGSPKYIYIINLTADQMAKLNISYDKDVSTTVGGISRRVRCR